jgi:hypothetical protein
MFHLEYNQTFITRFVDIAIKVHSQWPVIAYLTPRCNNIYKWCTEAMLLRHPGVR